MLNLDLQGPRRSRLGLVAGVAVVLALTCSASAVASVRGSRAAPISKTVVVVTNTSDRVNGRVSSIAALNAHPGRDGISLREALSAADKTKGSATVYIMFSHALNGQTITPRAELPSISRNHFVLEGIAPSGAPATVTLDGRRVTATGINQAILLVQASEVTVRWLRFTGVMPYSNPASQEFAVHVAPGTYVHQRNTPPAPRQIANVQIVDNAFDNSDVPLYSGFAGTNGVTIVGDQTALGLRVSGVAIARNTFLHFGKGNGEAVGVWATSPGERVQGVVIMDNKMDQDMLGIELGLGSGAPRIAGTQIIGNTITGSENAITLNTTAPNQMTSDGTIDGTLIERNLISGVQGPAMALGAALNTQIVNNVVHADFSGPGLAGIYMPAGGDTSSPVTIENDTFVNEEQASLFVTVATQSGVSGNNAIVRNSIFYSPTGPSPIYVGGPGNSTAPEVLTNSLISGPGWAGTNGNITANPMFVNEPQGDYHLTAASPAINAGTTIGAPPFDLDGTRRDAQPDIGAFEYGAAPRPLLTVTVYPLGGNGTITSNPAGISCGATCSVQLDANTKITLTAKPDRWSRFLGWGGACSDTRRCTVTLSGSKSVAARFGSK